MSYRSKSGKLHALLTPVCGDCQTKYLKEPAAVKTKDGGVYDFKKYTRKHNVYQLGTCKNYTKSNSDGVMVSFVELDESHQLYSMLEAGGQGGADVQPPTVAVPVPVTNAQMIADQVKEQVEKVAQTFQESMVQQLAQQKEQLMKSMATSVAAIPAPVAEQSAAEEMRMQRQMLMSLYQQQQQQAGHQQQVQYHNYQLQQGGIQPMWGHPQNQIADQQRATPARRGQPALQAANGGRQLGTGL
jgi:hypothetical protein